MKKLRLKQYPSKKKFTVQTHSMQTPPENQVEKGALAKTRRWHGSKPLSGTLGPSPIQTGPATGGKPNPQPVPGPSPPPPPRRRTAGRPGWSAAQPASGAAGLGRSPYHSSSAAGRERPGEWPAHFLFLMPKSSERGGPKAQKIVRSGQKRVDSGGELCLLASLDHRPSTQIVKKWFFEILIFDPIRAPDRPLALGLKGGPQGAVPDRKKNQNVSRVRVPPPAGASLGRGGPGRPACPPTRIPTPGAAASACTASGSSPATCEAPRQPWVPLLH